MYPVQFLLIVRKRTVIFDEKQNTRKKEQDAKSSPKEQQPWVWRVGIKDDVSKTLNNEKQRIQV